MRKASKLFTRSNGVRTVQISPHNPVNAFTMGYLAQKAGFTPTQFKDFVVDNPLAASCS